MASDAVPALEEQPFPEFKGSFKATGSFLRRSKFATTASEERGGEASYVTH
jgi:hypothetical protein